MLTVQGMSHRPLEWFGLSPLLCIKWSLCDKWLSLYSRSHVISLILVTLFSAPNDTVQTYLCKRDEANSWEELIFPELLQHFVSEATDSTFTEKLFMYWSFILSPQKCCTFFDYRSITFILLWVSSNRVLQNRIMMKRLIFSGVKQWGKVSKCFW